MNFKNLKLNKKKISSLTMIVSLSMIISGCGNSNSKKDFDQSSAATVPSTTYNNSNQYN